MKRNSKIKRLRIEKHLFLREIGKIFKISTERVRQICEEIPKRYCKIHKRNYIGFCRWCKVEKSYKEILRRLMKNGILDDIRRLSRNDRSQEMVIQRDMLISMLYKKYKLSPFVISKLFGGRDHTTILHSLHKTKSYDKRIKRKKRRIRVSTQ